MWVPRIAASGHEIAAIASPYSFGGNCLEWNGFKVLPCARDNAGNDTITATHEYFKADLTITLADVFGLIKVAQAGTLREINLAHVFPVDCHPLGEGDALVLREGGGIPIAISRFGEQVLYNEGAEPLYVPHGVDTQIYCPGDPAPYRDTIPGVTDDTFVIGLLAMNRDVRKGIAEQMIAFANFHANHPDSILAMHTSPYANPGINITGLATRLGITEAVKFPDSYSYDIGIISEEHLASWYRGLDILSLCSYGEGFGLPLIEAQSCGIPVVTTDASATTELCGAGWTVAGTLYWSNGHAAWWVRPDVNDIEQAYEAAWYAREDGTLPKKNAREFAMLYDADRVFEQYWKPTLDVLEERIK